MEVRLKVARPATYADDLAVELARAHRHELIDGVIVAMAGGSDEHNAFSSPLGSLSGLDRSPRARPYAEGLRARIVISLGRGAASTSLGGRPIPFL